MPSGNQQQKTSFFDDGRKSNFEFVKPSPKHQKYITIPPSIATRLVSQELSSNSSRTGIYALHNRLLAYYTSEVSCFPEMVLDLNRSRLKILTPNKAHSSYGFRLIKNGISFDFYSSDKESIEIWTANLRSVCILINFHEEYKAIKAIGSGSFAKVYLVESKITKKLFAAKAFSKDQILSSPKENTRLSISNEIDLMRQMDHPNIIKLYEVYETDNSIYLILELIHCKSLRDVLKSSSFRKDSAQTKIMELIHSILSALAFLASKGIVHRDLKPANILAEKGHSLKIIDFGLATLIKQRKFIFRKCGTPGYIAPEIFKYSENNPETLFDDRCDIFSVGCVFYYMLFNAQFFDAVDATEALYLNKTFSMESEPILKMQAEISNPLSKINKNALDLLLQMVEIDPKRRISAEQALNHPYFQNMQKATATSIATKGSSVFSGSKANNSEHISSIGLRHSEEHLVPGFQEEHSDSEGSVSRKGSDKESFYLDTKWSNGKVDHPNSAGNSFTQESGFGRSSPTVEVTSPFEKGQVPENTGRYYKGRGSKGPLQHNQSVLKAAIMKNMYRNNEAGGEEMKKDEVFKPNFGRRHSEDALLKIKQIKSEPRSQNEDSSDTDDIGVEENDVQDKITFLSKEKHPSKTAQTSRQFYRLISQ